jgi:hypothetical protein
MVAAKLWMCAGGVLLVGGSLLAAIVIGWALPTGHWAEMCDRLITLSGSGWAAGMVLLGGLVVLFVITWGQLASGLWVCLTGRDHIIAGALAVGLALVTGFALLLIQGVMEPTWRSQLALYLPWVLASVLALKCALTATVYWANLQRGLLSLRTVVLVFIAWTAAATGLFSGLAWLVPQEAVTRVHLAEGVALVLPIARIGLAPLALTWNRHR